VFPFLTVQNYTSGPSDPKSPRYAADTCINPSHAWAFTSRSWRCVDFDFGAKVPERQPRRLQCPGKVDPNYDSLGKIERKESPQAASVDAGDQAGDRHSITNASMECGRPKIHSSQAKY
jgi:hypothetical protein